MAFVADSRYKGYLGPHPDPYPQFGDTWEDFLHDLVAGVTGMPGDKVFPRWQPEPPVRPNHDVDWAGVGINEITADWQAYVQHYPSSAAHPDGYDALQHMETTIVLTSFYGPNATKNATLLRSGLFIEQNLAELRKADVGLVEVQAFQNAPELFKQKWVDRVDVPVVLRREIRFDYPVLNLLAAAGMITGNTPGDQRNVVTVFDTQESYHMAEGLPVSRVVDVDVNFTPVAAPAAAFDTLLIMGDSSVLSSGEGIRAYESMEEVAADFTSTAPEFLAAQLYFSQTPQPNTLFIGRWARTPTAGVLVGGPLTTAEQQMASWNAITTGAFKIGVNGVAPVDVTGLNFSSDTNLNGVAAKIDTAFAGGTVVWDAVRDRFLFTSGTAGPTSAVSFLTAPTAGVDISAKLRGTAGTAERASSGIAAEANPVDAVIRVDGLGWYACMFASSVPLTDAQHLAISGYIEATNEKHLYGVTSNSAIILDPAQTVDIASSASLADYTRTMVQYSIYNPYAIASIFGRAFSTNFEGSNTTITLKFKREPGVLPEFLTTTQANTLMAKRCNVYIGYNNDTAIYQEGVMSGPAYFDEIHGLDWLANRIQNDLWNLLYQSPKVPQTDSGIHGMLTRCESSLAQGVNNGLIAPGIWNAPGFGILYDGAYLEKGWYSYVDSVDNQSQSIREQRIAPLIQIAVKMAGAVHFASVLINVNR